MAPIPPPPPLPAIFDRALLRARLARAARRSSAHFLLARATEDLVDRLTPVLRTFAAVLDCGSPGPAVADALGRVLPAATVTRLQTGAEGRPVEARTALVTGDEERLPFAPGSFDLAVSCLALQSVNDLPGTLIQLRRTLRPDGLFLACLLGGQTLSELRGVLAGAESEVLGGASPRVAPFADLRDLGGLLQRAGFALPVTDTDLITVRYGSVFGLMADLRAMGLANVLVERRRQPTPRAVMLRAAQLYAARFADPDGRVRATFELVWLSGWAPHESQQKPLQPGTARMRLADALAAVRIEPKA